MAYPPSHPAVLDDGAAIDSAEPRCVAEAGCDAVSAAAGSMVGTVVAPEVVAVAADATRLARRSRSIRGRGEVTTGAATPVEADAVTRSLDPRVATRNTRIASASASAAPVVRLTRLLLITPLHQSLVMEVCALGSAAR